MIITRGAMNISSQVGLGLFDHLPKRLLTAAPG
jgi:hypothetical protein